MNSQIISPLNSEISSPLNSGIISPLNCELSSPGAGRFVQVINTPDLANPPKSPKKAREEVNKWIKLADRRNPDAVLLVVCCDRRYTKEEYEIYMQLKSLLQKKLPQGTRLQDSLVVVFTMGGSLNGMDLGVVLSEVCDELQSVLGEAGQRYVVFDNMADDEGKKASVDTLLEIVQSKGE